MAGRKGRVLGSLCVFLVWFSISNCWADNWPNWYYQIGGLNVASAPSVVMNTDGRLEIFAQQAGSVTPYHNWQTTPGGAWAGWESLGGGAIGTPAAAKNLDGRLESFALGGGSFIYYNLQNTPGVDSWTGWWSIGSATFSTAPVATINADGRLEIFGRGTDGAIWHNWQTTPGGSWAGWQSLGGYILGTLSVAINTNGCLEIFVVGSDNSVYHNWQMSPSSSQWSGWQGMGGYVLGTPSVARNSDGRLEIFVLGSDSTVFHNWQVSAGSNQWSGWTRLDGTTWASTPSVIAGIDGRLQLFAQQAGSAAPYWNAQVSAGSNAWSGWASLGGNVVGTPSVAMNADGRLELFVSDGTYSYYQLQGLPGSGDGSAPFPGSFKIANQLSGKVLDVTGLSLASGALIQQWDWLQGGNQQWRIIPIGNGYVQVMNLNSSKVLDDTNYSTSNATEIQQYSWLGGDNQQWLLVPTGNGYYAIRNKLSGKVLDVAGYSTANGAPIQQWDWLQGANQQWSITSYSDPNATTGIAGVTGPLVPQSPPNAAPAPAPPVPVSGSVTNCNDISGNWVDAYSNRFRLSQNGSTVSGDTVQPDQACGTVVWKITGYATGPNTFALTEFNPNLSVDSCGRTVEQQETANVTITGCSQAQEVFTGGSGSGSRFASLGTGSGGSGKLWTRESAAPAVQVTVDLLNDTVTTLATSQNKTANLSLAIKNSAGTTTNLAEHSVAQAARFTDSLQRTSLPVGQYGSVVATWDNLSLTIPVSFYVIGNTRFSQYNVPYESQCPNNPQTAWLIYKIDANYCYWKPALMGSQFISQTEENGTGVSNNYGMLKGYHAGAGPLCPIPTGAKTDGSNTFYSVDTGGNSLNKIKGSPPCNTVLSDGTGLPNDLLNNNPKAGTLAVDPNKLGAVSSNPLYACSDQILMIDQSNNYDLRTVQDKCPACSGGFGAPNFPGTVAHIDTFNSSQTCNANALGDYGDRIAIRLR